MLHIIQTFIPNPFMKVCYSKLFLLFVVSYIKNRKKKNRKNTGKNCYDCAKPQTPEHLNGLYSCTPDSMYPCMYPRTCTSYVSDCTIAPRLVTYNKLYCFVPLDSSSNLQTSLSVLCYCFDYTISSHLFILTGMY